MGKRGNDNSQLTKEDYEAAMADSSDAPQGPFARATSDVMKSRRIIKARKFGVKKTATAPKPVGNSIFSGVSLTSSSTKSSGANPFGDFTFGSSTSKTTAAPSPATTTMAFPSFATPAATSKAPAATKSTTTPQTNKEGETISEVAKLRIACAKSFLDQLNSDEGIDHKGYRQFIRTFESIGQPKSSTTEKNLTKAPGASKSWDNSRPLFGGKSPSTTAASSAAPLFGASPTPAPATGGFSFSLPKPAASAAPAPSTGFSFNVDKPSTPSAPVPAFSFSTTPAPAVKAAAEAAAVETSAKGTSSSADNDDNDAKEEATTVLENEENNDYNVLFKTVTKIFRVSTASYIRGDLKIEQHKDSKKTRLVVRESTVGRVQMNVAINKGMPLSKDISRKTKNNQIIEVAIVIISAVFDENSKKPELFKIIVRSKEDQNGLYNELSKHV